MSGDNNLLNLMVNKFGLDRSITRKADEIIRLIKLKSNSSINKCSDTALIVISLNIACMELGHNFDKDLAIKLSGMKPRSYTSYIELCKKILGLGTTLTIKDLCVLTNCSSIIDQCEKVYEKYKESDKMGTKNFEHPQYICVLVYVMCRLNKIKVQKSQFRLCNLKNLQWMQLESDICKFIENVGTQEKERSLKNSLKDVEDKLNENLNLNRKAKSNINDEEESYEEWKARMLKFAREV